MNGGACRIGVLGGIGPEATCEFYSKLIERLQRSRIIKRNQDFPQIFVNSVPAPELIKEKVSDKELMPYVQGLKEIDAFNPNFIAMVCNTIHLFHSRLQKQVKTPILDLKEEVGACLKRQKIKKMMVIGTPCTLKQGLYNFNEIECLQPNEQEINRLSKSIHLFNRGTEKEKQAEIVSSVCKKYLDLGAETVVLGCTEFAVMLKQKPFPKVDTIDVLAEACFERVKESFK